jgi:hypothetical protein
VTLLKNSDGTAGYSYSSIIDRLPRVSLFNYGLTNGGSIDAPLALAQADAPSDGAIFTAPAGEYTSTAQIELGDRQILACDGDLFSANYKGAATISTTFDGQAVLLNGAAGSGLDGVVIKGDLTKTSQDLVTVGDGSGNQGTARLVNVGIANAGRDGLVIDNSYNGLFERTRVDKSGQHNLRLHDQANANVFTKCLFRQATQWGVLIHGGKAVKFEGCTIESNSTAALGTDYGAMWVAADEWDCLVTLDTCHFEGNDGVGGTGLGLVQDKPSTHLNSITDIGCYWDDESGLSLTGGTYQSVGSWYQHASPTVTIGVDHVRSVFINPRRSGTGGATNGDTFVGMVDNSGRSIVIGPVGVSAKDGIIIGNDTVLYRDAADTWKTTDTFRSSVALGTAHVAAATPTGGSSGDIKIGNSKIWVNDAGTWKSVAVA